MDLKPTRLEHTYEVGDESGYRFKVVAEWHDDEGPPYRLGWSATVTMQTHGLDSAENAIEDLAQSAEAFVRQVKALVGAK